jgi:hypothetical protein
MPPSNLLKQYGLARNPFTDRTAENTAMEAFCVYEHSDLQDFKPSNQTYIFFGKRGSGKTTIRMKMQRAYERANEEEEIEGHAPYFIIDLCKPGHMTACLKDFQVCMQTLLRKHKSAGHRAEAHLQQCSVLNDEACVLLHATLSHSGLNTSRRCWLQRPGRRVQVVVADVASISTRLLVTRSQVADHVDSVAGEHRQHRRELGLSVQEELDD